MRRQWHNFAASKFSPASTFQAFNPFSKGRCNQKIGASFEDLIRGAAAKEGLMLIVNGLRAKRYGTTVVAERSNLDFLLLGDASQKEVAFLDGKSFAGRRFGRSTIARHQLLLAQQYSSRGFCAGFIVLLREIDHVGFYSAATLAGGAFRQGFSPDDSVTLGNRNNFKLRPIWPTPVAAKNH